MLVLFLQAKQFVLKLVELVAEDCTLSPFGLDEFVAGHGFGLEGVEFIGDCFEEFLFLGEFNVELVVMIGLSVGKYFMVFLLFL